MDDCFDMWWQWWIFIKLRFWGWIYCFPWSEWSRFKFPKGQTGFCLTCKSEAFHTFFWPHRILPFVLIDAKAPDHREMVWFDRHILWLSWVINENLGLNLMNEGKVLEFGGWVFLEKLGEFAIGFGNPLPVWLVLEINVL